ncbi:MAG TPA: anti-sigma factor [bacterium]|nr:anti-sigma factor [bacterium]
MTQNHAEFLDLCAAHALDSLDDVERAKLERHLADCVQCTHALADFREDALTLAVAVATPPPPAAKLRILNAIREPITPLHEAAAAPVSLPPVEQAARPRFSWFGTLGWAAAAVLALAYFKEVQGSRQLAAQLQTLQARNQEAETALASEKGWMDSMSSPDARLAQLTPTPQNPSAHEGWALFDPQTRRAILVFENLTLPSEKDYELWAIREAGPESLGVLQVGPNGRAFVRLQEIPDAERVGAFAVSLEGKGGSPNKNAPSGPVVMVGTL